MRQMSSALTKLK
ncbi:hypothetical protein Prudu_002185, partial [Prunus dulcis]